MALHTASGLLKFHPHIHSIVLDGEMDCNGKFYSEPALDKNRELLEKVFKEEVFNSLLSKELITEEVIDGMNSWENSGFSVFIGDRILSSDTERRKFLARYLKKSPVSNKRIELIESSLDLTVRYHDRTSHHQSYQDFSPLEFLATLQQHIPNTWEQTTRFLGCYASKTRGTYPGFCAPQKLVIGITGTTNDKQEAKEEPSSLFAILMKLVFELDPMVCSKCGEHMEIKAFILDPKEIARICANLDIPPYRAPPPFTSYSSNAIPSTGAL